MIQMITVIIMGWLAAGLLAYFLFSLCGEAISEEKIPLKRCLLWGYFSLGIAVFMVGLVVFYSPDHDD